MKIFYVIYLKGEVLHDCLNAIRLIAQPTAKHSAHITVRGPYTDEVDAVTLAEFEKKHVWITINGVGRFENPHQHVVYFACKAPGLEELWWKPNFPTFIPHITLYSGRSKKDADAIYKIVSKYPYSFLNFAYGLELLTTGSDARNAQYPCTFNEERISQVVSERSIDTKTLLVMPLHQRLMMIDHLCRFFSFLSHASMEEGAYIGSLSWEEYDKWLRMKLRFSNKFS